MLRQEIKQTDRMSKESKKEETVREIISVKNLYKLYRVGDSVVRALDGVSFSVYEGEFCAIVGTSGSGKSTLLNMLAGLEKPTRGEVIVAGKHIEQMKENELVKFRGENVGFIFQSFHLMGTDECTGKCGASAYISRRAEKRTNKKSRQNAGSGELGKT